MALRSGTLVWYGCVEAYVGMVWLYGGIRGYGMVVWRHTWVWYGCMEAYVGVVWLYGGIRGCGMAVWRHTGVWYGCMEAYVGEVCLCEVTDKLTFARWSEIRVV